mgnify:CR=1 FL=1
MAKGNFVLVQLTNPDHIVCLQGISDDRQYFLYKDSDGTTELKEFPVKKMTYAMIWSFDKENESEDEQAFRFPNLASGPGGRKRPNWTVVKKMLEAAHEKASKELTNCKYPTISFEKYGRHMHDVGHVLEFQSKNPSTECGTQDEQAGVIVEDFDAWYEHEISVKMGDQVQVKNG